MRIIGLLVARNEAWCLSASLSAALQWLDGLVVMVHASTDRTRAIVDDARRRSSKPVVVDSVDTSAWDEATYRGAMLRAGRVLGGTHFAIIDADEVLTAGAMGAIRAEAANLAPGELLRLPWIHCWRSLYFYRCDSGTFGTARVPFLFADAPRLHYAAGPNGYQLHTRAPRGVTSREIWARDDGLGVLHLQHVVWERLLAKQTLYQMDEILRYGRIHANYAGTVDEAGLLTAEIPEDWWPVNPRATIDFVAEPWQAKECRRLVAMHGMDRFAAVKRFPGGPI